VQASLVSTGEYVRIADTFANGDDVVINMATGKVTKNATLCVDKVSIASKFFGVPTGSQTIAITSDGFYIAAMDYTKRYMYA
jgi:stringent starvation protein B